jgi:hypothetical protein
VIYFMERNGLIKIGFSESPHVRASHLRSNLIGCINGTRLLERQLHVRFGNFRVKGEWFKDALELREFISGSKCFIPERPNSMIGVNPEKALLEKIRAEAKREHRKLGPMVCEILRRWFEQQEANNHAKP